MGKVLVTGSLAYDHIMDFPGKFSEHILPDKIHILNVSFLVDRLKKQWGGTAGNIAYNLALLDESPMVLAAAGKDFSTYHKHLTKAGVDLSQVREYQSDFTSTFFVITDQGDNQLAGFYLGVMEKAQKLSIKKVPGKVSLSIVSPNDPQAMINYTRECRELQIPFIFDPGQQIPRLSGKDIKDCLRGAKVLIGNDYEMELIRRKTGWSNSDILKKVETIISTKGADGSEVLTKNSHLFVPAVKAKKVVDPTGAGDAFRAGIIKGILKNWDWRKSGQVASLAAVYAVEHYGTQEHRYSLSEFTKRYKDNFGQL